MRFSGDQSLLTPSVSNRSLGTTPREVARAWARTWYTAASSRDAGGDVQGVGWFQGLDLNEELYLGGYPDYGAIPKAGLSSGFIGEPLCPLPAALARPPPGLAEPMVTQEDQEDVVTRASGHPHLYLNAFTAMWRRGES